MVFSMLKTLCDAFGVSGCEEEVREIIIKNMSDKCIVSVDKLGNVICFKKGTSASAKKIALFAHMDEVGLIVSQITDEGYLKFKTVGGIDPRVLASKKVVIGKNGINGVIGVKPKHQLGKDDDKAATVKDMYIDIGANNADSAAAHVSLGDYICFDGNYSTFGNGLVKSKALDNRVGCYILMRLAMCSAQEDYPHDIYFTFTVMEEIGCRGAAAAAYEIQPDYAVVVETTTCSDTPGTSPHGYSTKLGNGAAISLLDMGSYSDRDIVRLLSEAAEKNNIMYQYKQTTLGGNDASTVHISGSGVKTGAISVPCRYIHSPVCVASEADIESCYSILNNVLKEEEVWSF